MAIMGLPEEEYFAVGHRACAGCGAAIAMRLVTKAAGKDSVICQSTGCMEVISTPYPETSWKLPWIHGAFENAAAIAAGVREALNAQGKQHIKVIGVGGDGGTYDIGLRGLSGAFERGHDFTFVCYDNEAYMNTGIQRSGATPFGASTTTSPSGKASIGKVEWKKNLVEILAAHDSPYVATASIAYPQDAYKKITKAIETKGPAFINLYAPCVPGWRIDGAQTVALSKLAVETGIYPLYEIIEGKHTLNNPKSIDNLKPVEDYLKLQGRFKHLFKPQPKTDDLAQIGQEVKKRLGKIIAQQEAGL